MSDAPAVEQTNAPAPALTGPPPASNASTMTAKQTGSTPSGTHARRTTATSSATSSRPVSSTRSSTTATSGLSKPPTRPGVGSSLTKRPSTATSTMSHRSQPSFSGDEKKSTASTAARRTSTATTGSTAESPGKTRTATGAAATTSTVKKPLSSITATAKAPLVKPSSTAGSAAPTTAARAAPKPADSTSRLAERKKRLSSISSGGVSTISASARTAIRSSVHPSTSTVSSADVVAAAVAESAKEIEELKGKLADSETEIAGLNIQKFSYEKQIAELTGKRSGHEQDGILVVNEALTGDENDSIETLKAQHAEELEALKQQLSGIKEELKSTETELVAQKAQIQVVTHAKNAAEAEIASLVQKFAKLEAESNATITEKDEVLKKANKDHANSIAVMHRSLDEKYQVALKDLETRYAAEKSGQSGMTEAHDQAVQELKSAHEAAMAKLQNKLDESAATQLALMAAQKEKADNEKKLYMKHRSKLESEMSELKIKLATAEAAMQDTKKELEGRADFRIDLEKKSAGFFDLEREVKELHKKLAAAESQLEAARSMILARDTEVEKVKDEVKATVEKYEERVQQVSKDYEKEIEELKGNAFFKRKFKDLDIAHKELTQKYEDALRSHAAALEAVKNEHEAALKTMEEKETEHQNAVAALQASHIEEIEGAKSAAIKEQEAIFQELKTLKTGHAEGIERAKEESRATLAKELDALQAKQDEVVATIRSDHSKQLERLERKHASERDELAASHAQEVATARSAGDDALAARLQQREKELSEKHDEEVRALQIQLEGMKSLYTDFEALKAKLDEVESQQSASIEEIKKQQEDFHQAEISKLLSTHAEVLEAAKKESMIDAQAQVKEAKAKDAEAYGKLKAEHEAASEQLKLLEASNTELKAAVELAKKESQKTQDKLHDVSEQFSRAKTERFMLMARLEAVKTGKPDTSELERAKAQLAALEEIRSSQVSERNGLLAEKEAQLKDLDEAGELAKKLAADHAATRSELAEVQKQQQQQQEHWQKAVEVLKEDLSIAQEKLVAAEQEADAKKQTADANYNDMHLTLTKVAEEAQAKLQEAEKEKEEAEKRMAEMERKAADVEGRFAELEAQLTVKDAEIAETKAKTDGPKSAGLVASRHAKGADTNGDDATASAGGTVEGETEQDHSSAALASLASLQYMARELMAEVDQMSGDNYRILKSISDVKATFSPEPANDRRVFEAGASNHTVNASSPVGGALSPFASTCSPVESVCSHTGMSARPIESEAKESHSFSSVGTSDRPSMVNE